MSAQRTTSTKTTTRVRYLAKPMGRSNENGPHLADLRAFVEACEGLPDDLHVTISKGHMGESGRYDVEFSAVHTVPACSCGKPFPEDGGAEGVCECCSGCGGEP